MTAPLQNARTLSLLCLVTAGWAFNFGLGAPLASLWLSDLEQSATIVGMNTGVYYLGIALTALVVPRLMRRLGKWCPCLGFALTGASVLLFPWGGGLFGWFLLRFLNGIGGAMSLMPLERYVNRHSPPQQRARNFGCYAVAIAIGWALGNLIGLQMFDHAARWAFVLGGAISLSVIPLVMVGLRWPTEPEVERAPAAPTPWRQGLLSFGSGWVQGFLEGAMVSLLPIYLLFLGHSKEEISWLTSGIMIGVILLQVPVAWLADLFGRSAVLLGCHSVVLAGLGSLPFCSGHILLPLCLFLVGACSGAFYPLGLSLLGERIRDAALARATTCYLVLNCLGSLVGPILTGIVMDLYGKSFLPAVCLGACLIVLGVWLLFRQPHRSATAPISYLYRGTSEAA